MRLKASPGLKFFMFVSDILARNLVVTGYVNGGNARSQGWTKTGIQLAYVEDNALAENTVKPVMRHPWWETSLQWGTIYLSQLFYLMSSNISLTTNHLLREIAFWWPLGWSLIAGFTVCACLHWCELGRIRNTVLYIYERMNRGRCQRPCSFCIMAWHNSTITLSFSRDQHKFKKLSGKCRDFG